MTNLCRKKRELKYICKSKNCETPVSLNPVASHAAEEKLKSVNLKLRPLTPLGSHEGNSPLLFVPVFEEVSQLDQHAYE